MISSHLIPLTGLVPRGLPVCQIVCWGLAWLTWPSPGFAQSPVSTESQTVHWVHMLQGEPLRVTEDFVARLDGDKIRIALMDHGIVRRPSSSDLQITLINPDKPPQSSRPDERGELVFSDVKAGLNVLLVLGSDSAAASQSMTYAAFAFFAQIPAAAVNGNAAASGRLDVPITRVPSRTVLEDLENVGSSDELGNVAQLDEAPASSPHRFRVARDVEQVLHGRVIAAQAGIDQRPGSVRVRLSRDGRSVATATTDRDGRFALSNITPGVYSISAVGPAGYAAFSVEIVDAGPPTADRRLPGAGEGIRYIARQDNAQDELLILLIPPNVIDQVQEVLREHIEATEGAAEDDSIGAPLAGGNMETNNANATSGVGGAFAGGGQAVGGASGGGVGGGGSAGALFGAAGLAVGVAALASDDDGFNPPIASPITPSRQ